MSPRSKALLTIHEFLLSLETAQAHSNKHACDQRLFTQAHLMTLKPLYFIYRATAWVNQFNKNWLGHFNFIYRAIQTLLGSTKNWLDILTFQPSLTIQPSCSDNSPPVALPLAEPKPYKSEVINQVGHTCLSNLIYTVQLWPFAIAISPINAWLLILTQRLPTASLAHSASYQKATHST